MRLVLGATKFWWCRKKMENRFQFQTARAEWINNIMKIMFEFMFSNMNQAYTWLLISFIP